MHDFLEDSCSCDAGVGHSRRLSRNHEDWDPVGKGLRGTREQAREGCYGWKDNI